MKILYKDNIDEGYRLNMEVFDVEMTKIQFLAQFFFEFEMDDDDMYELFGRDMLEVIECILNENTHEYIKDQSNYIKYLTMVNMPFMEGKLDSGISIRGAWFDDYDSYECCGIPIPNGQLTNFLRQVIEWAKE